jgi:hypothetical protein
MLVDGLSEKCSSILLITGLTQIKINNIAVHVHGAIIVNPAPFNFYVGFIHSPRARDSALSLPEYDVELRCVFDNPTVQVKMDISLSEHILNFTVTEFVGQIIAKGLHDDIRWIMSPREVKYHAVDAPN